MKINRIFTAGAMLVIGLLLIRADVICAQSEKTKTLLLDEFIKLACERDGTFQEILIDELALKYKKAIGLPAGDFVISLTSEYNFLLDYHKSERDDTISLSKLFELTKRIEILENNTKEDKMENTDGYLCTRIIKYESIEARTFNNVSKFLDIDADQPIEYLTYGSMKAAKEEGYLYKDKK